MFIAGLSRGVGGILGGGQEEPVPPLARIGAGAETSDNVAEHPVWLSYVDPETESFIWMYVVSAHG